MEIKSKIRIIALALLTCIVFFSCAKEDKLVLYNGHEVHESTVKSLEGLKETFENDLKLDYTKLLGYEDWYYKYFDKIDKTFKTIKDDYAIIIEKSKDNSDDYREHFFKTMYEYYKTKIVNERIQYLDDNVKNPKNYSGLELQINTANFEDALKDVHKGFNYEDWYSKYKDVIDLEIADSTREKYKEHIYDEYFDYKAFAEERAKELYELLSGYYNAYDKENSNKN